MAAAVKMFNTGDKDVDRSLNKAYKDFVEHLKSNWGAKKVTNPAALRKLFLGRMHDSLQMDYESQADHHVRAWDPELYGSDIRKCVEFYPGDDDGDDEDE